jgi:predicted DNA-binding ribbon-helix-helix protein
MTRDRVAVRKRSVTVAGHATSVSLEEDYWEALAEIARRRGMSINGLIAEIDAERHSGGLSSAIRLHVLAEFRRRADAGESSA